MHMGFYFGNVVNSRGHVMSRCEIDTEQNKTGEVCIAGADNCYKFDPPDHTL
jgi:hypothetical protein